MAVHSINSITDRAADSSTQQVTQAQKRVQLFSSSRFEAGRATFAGIGKVDLSAITGSQNQDSSAAEQVEAAEEAVTVRIGKQTIEMPQLTKEQRAQAEAAFAQAGDQRAQLEQSALALGAAALQEVVNNPDAATGGDVSLQASSAAQTSLENWMVGAGEANRETATTNTIVSGMWGVEQNLYGFMQNLQDQSNLSDEVRTDAADINSMLADWPADGSTELVSYHDVTINSDGTTSVQFHQDVPMTKAQAQALLDKLNNEIDSLGSLTQQGTQTLQMYTYKYQQAMDCISNMLKNQDDTRKALINNAKA